MISKTILLALLLFSQLNAHAQTIEPQGPLRKKTIKLATGIEMSYTERGKPGGEVLILLHGYTDSGRSFYPTTDSLIRIFPDLYILIPDLRGHGSSSMPDPQQCAATPEVCFTMADFAADIIALMDQKQIHQAHIGGHSMGSAVAQEIALSYTSRVRSLIMIGTFISGTGNAAISDFLLASTIEGTWKTALDKRPNFEWPRDAYLLSPSDVDTNIQEWMKQNWVADAVANEKFLQQILPETSRVPIGTWLGAIRHLSKFDNTQRLQKLLVPTLALWAIQDNFFPEYPDQQALRKALHQAASTGHINYFFKIYGKQPLPPSGLQASDLGHNLHWGAPQAVAEDIASFITTGKPTTSLAYADPANVKRVLLEKNGATILDQGSE